MKNRKKKLKVIKEFIRTNFKEVKKPEEEKLEEENLEEEIDGFDGNNFVSSFQTNGLKPSLSRQETIEQQLENSTSERKPETNDETTYSASYSNNNYSDSKYKLRQEEEKIVKPMRFFEESQAPVARNIKPEMQKEWQEERPETKYEGIEDKVKIEKIPAFDRKRRIIA